MHMLLFAQDKGVSFSLEHAWRLLKDEHKWMGASTEKLFEKDKQF